MINALAPSGTTIHYGVYEEYGTPYHIELQAIIEAIVKMKRDAFVGHAYDADDLGQEIRIRLTQAASALDNERPAFRYLIRCADNLISDLRKGIYQHNNPPCKICADGGDCTRTGDKCESFRRYQRHMFSKQSIDRPRSLMSTDLIRFDTAFDSLNAKELNERIIAILPQYLLKPYHNMLHSGNITAVQRNQIRSIVRKLLEDDQKRSS